MKKKKKRTPKYKAPMPTYHYTAAYLLAPTHPVTINLIGLGGTGSEVLKNIARMHISLRALGHPGFMVNAWDGDVITEANIGRQLYFKPDIGLNKAIVLMGRINRAYGLGWQAIPRNWNKSNIPAEMANIYISCVDTVKVRRAIHTFFKALKNSHNIAESSRPIYWQDYGNSQTIGQVIMGTVVPVMNDGKTQSLPNIFDLFPTMERHEKRSGPSCSLAEALDKQDLFINSSLAQFGCDILWKMFRHARIEHHGVFLNLETMTTNPLKV